MRDILLTLIVLGTLPYILARPYIGVYVWSWLGYMNPQRLTWGFAYNMPFSAIVAGFLFIGMLFSKEKYRFPKHRITMVWLMFVIWVCVTTVLAVNVDAAVTEFSRFIKIQIVIFCTLLLINTKDKLLNLVWVIVVSIGFYSVKGGVFSIVTGLQYRVIGPAKSFFGDNNTMALTTLMVIPLMYYLLMTYKNKYIRAGLMVAILLSFLSVIASYSRGAFLTAIVMLFFLWLGSKHKVIIMSLIIMAIIAVIPFVPQKWFARMDTIETYKQDQSAVGRLNAWGFAINVANSSPLIGGGFHVFSPELFKIYAPNPNNYHDAHSIYFEVLGEQGYLGLIFYLFIWLFVFLEVRRLKTLTKSRNQLLWMYDLVRMIQLGLISYMTGGAFLGLAYFDLPYHYMSIIVIAGVLCRKHLESEPSNDNRQNLSYTH